jgi:uncharacterized protein
MSKSKYSGFEALDPFFEIVIKGLSKYVDGEHYFDTLADQVVFEFLYEFPGWPRQTRGRENVIALYSGYGRNIRLDRANSLLVHPSDDGRVVILEYEVHGRILSNNAVYDNRSASIAMIQSRRIVRWRDYMDSLAAWMAINKSG